MVRLAHLSLELNAVKAWLIRGTGAAEVAAMTRDFPLAAVASLLSDCVVWFQSKRRKKGY